MATTRHKPWKLNYLWDGYPIGVIRQENGPGRDCRARSLPWAPEPKDGQLHSRSFGVLAVLEHVPDVGRRGQVALGVEAELADDRVPSLGTQRVGNLLGVRRTGLGHGLRPHLDRGVGAERVAFRLETALAELVNHVLGGRQIAGFGGVG